jgi:hypothetical protein
MITDTAEEAGVEITEQLDRGPSFTQPTRVDLPHDSREVVGQPLVLLWGVGPYGVRALR